MIHSLPEQAVRRRQIVRNPCLLVRPPRLEEEEILTLTVKAAPLYWTSPRSAAMA
jgi:hypothetical protein